jgi:hypothetical protein
MTITIICLVAFLGATLLLSVGFACGVFAYLYTYVHFKKQEEVRASKRVMMAEQRALTQVDSTKQLLERLRARYGMDLSEKHAEGPSEEIKEVLSRGPHGG